MAFYDEDNNTRQTPAPVTSGGNAKTLGFFTGIIAIIVGVNGLVTSCAKERSDLEVAQRQYILAEESYWQRQYADLGLVFQMKEDTSARMYRLQALYLSGGLHVFEPERAGVTDEDRLTTTFDFLFLKFKMVFLEPGRGLSNKEVYELNKIGNLVLFENERIEKQRIRLADAEQKLNQLPDEYQSTADNAAPPATDGTTSPPPAAPPPSLVQLIAGKPEGYDFDIFWCEVSDKATEKRNFDEAMAVGNAITTKVKNNESIADQKLGRVRVRALPAGRQGFGYPTPSETAPWNVRYDAGDVTEMAIANEIARLTSPKFNFLPTPSYTKTKYYISLFVCHAKTQEPNVKTKNSAAPARASS